MDSVTGIVTRSGRRLSIEKSEKDDDARSTASTPTKKRPNKRLSIKPDLEDVMETDACAIQDFNNENKMSQILEENPIPDLLLKELRNMEFSSRNSPSQAKDSPSRNLRKRNTSVTSPEDVARSVQRKSPSSSENIILNSPTKKRAIRKPENSLLQHIVDSPKPRKKRTSTGGLEADAAQDTSTLRRSRRLSTDLNIVVEDPLREEELDLVLAPTTRKGKRLSTIPSQPSVPEENEDIKDSTSALTSPTVIQSAPSQRNQRKSPKAVSPNKSLNNQNSNLSKPNISVDFDLLDEIDAKNASVKENKLNVSSEKTDKISANKRISMSPKKRALGRYTDELTTPECITRENNTSEIQCPIEISDSQNQSELNLSTGKTAKQPVYSSESKLNSSQKSTTGNTAINISGRSSKSLNRSNLDIDEIKSVSSKNIDESLKLNFSDNLERNEDDNNVSVSEKVTNKVNNSSLKNSKSLYNSSLNEKSGSENEKALAALIHDDDDKCQSENIDIGNPNDEENITTSTPFFKNKKEKYKSTPPSNEKSPVSSGITEERTDVSREDFEVSSKDLTPDQEETPRRDKSKSHTQRNKINKSYESSSEDEDGMKISFVDSASDAGSNYQSGDSLDKSQREEIEMNEIVEKGESLYSETCESENDTYEKDSFVCSSNEESNEKLTSDDAIPEISPLKDNHSRRFMGFSKLSKSIDVITISKRDNDLLSKSQPNLSGSTPKLAKMYSPEIISSTSDLKGNVDKESKKRCFSDSSDTPNTDTSKSASQNKLSSSSERTPNNKQITKDLTNNKSLASSLEEKNAATQLKKRLSMNNSNNLSKTNYSINEEENDSLANSSSNSMSSPKSTQKNTNEKENNDYETGLSLEKSIHVSKSNDSASGDGDFLLDDQVNVSAGNVSTPNSTKKNKKDTSKIRLSLEDSIHISKSNDSAKSESEKDLSNSRINVSAGSISTPNSTKKIKKDTTESNDSKTRLSLNNSVHTSKSDDSAKGEIVNLSNNQVNVSAGNLSTPNSTKNIKKDKAEKNASKTRLSLEDSIHISKSNDSAKGESDNLSNSRINVSAGSKSTPSSNKKINKDTTERNASKTRLSLDKSIPISASGERENLSNSPVNVSTSSISTPNSTKKMKKDITERNASRARLSSENSVQVSLSNNSINIGNTDDAEEELVQNSVPEALSRVTYNMGDGSTDDSKMANEDTSSLKTNTSHLEVAVEDRSMEKKKNLPMSEVNSNIPPKGTNKRFKPQPVAANDFEVETISIENLPIGTKRKLSETDPNWTSTAGEFRVAKKPKAKPTRPISVSYAGSTTSFSIIPLKKTPKQVLLPDCEMESKVLNFKQDMLYGSRCQRKDSSKLLKIQQKLKASKNKGSY